LEAKSCLAHIGDSVSNFPNYIIKSCTNNGVWIVETHEDITNELIQYDFVNKDYTGPETDGNSLPYNEVTGERASQFLSLQKTLNNALLRD
jgi:hypothetical protein